MPMMQAASASGKASEIDESDVNPLVVAAIQYHVRAVADGLDISLAEGRAAVHVHEGRHPGRRHDGGGHRLCHRHVRHRGGAARHGESRSSSFVSGLTPGHHFGVQLSRLRQMRFFFKLLTEAGSPEQP